MEQQKKEFEEKLLKEQKENEELRKKNSLISNELLNMKSFISNSINKIETDDLENTKLITSLVEENKTLRNLLN